MVTDDKEKTGAPDFAALAREFLELLEAPAVLAEVAEESLRELHAEWTASEREVCADLASPTRWQGWPGKVTDALLTVQKAIISRGSLSQADNAKSDLDALHEAFMRIPPERRETLAAEITEERSEPVDCDDCGEDPECKRCEQPAPEPPLGGLTATEFAEVMRTGRPLAPAQVQAEHERDAARAEAEELKRTVMGQIAEKEMLTRKLNASENIRADARAALARAVELLRTCRAIIDNVEQAPSTTEAIRAFLAEHGK